MSWNRYDDVTGFSRALRRVLRRGLEHVRERAGRARMFVLNLDELIAVDDKTAFYRDRFFAVLGLDMPERTIHRIESISAAKSGPAPGGAQRRRAQRDRSLSRHRKTRRRNVRAVQAIASLKKAGAQTVRLRRRLSVMGA